MSWGSSLAGRIGKMPLVLAGPILRKVTDTSVTVWIALKSPASVTLSIYASDASGAPALGGGTAAPTKIGPNLYLGVVTAIVGTPLTPGTLYFYDLQFIAGNVLGLVAATGAVDMGEWAYPPHKLPSFLLPPSDLTKVRFALGSCRKLHSPNADALAILDDTLGANTDNVAMRPQILMMGGDQIYADEVTETLLLMLTDAGKVLIGDETLPVPGAPNTTPTQLSPYTRTKVVQAAGFTSDDTRSHLMGFGEYLAMYLFAWSDVLWRDWDANGKGGLPVIPALEDCMALVPSPDMPDREERLKILMQRTNIIVTYTTLSKVRRALANIATYMILDDHEITDDYNMQRRFCDGVYGSVLGMRVVQNGMLAYALCQHWGSCPEQFGTGTPGAQLLQIFASASDYPSIANMVPILPILGLHDSSELARRSPYGVYHDAGTSFTYNYTIEGKAFQLIVTDSRTWRSFPRAGGLSPPDLIQESQIPVQIGGTPALNDRLLLCVFTTNFPPCPSIRQAGRDLPSLSHKYDSEDFFDGWQIEQIDFARMVVELTKKSQTSTKFPNRIVMLSGDVHSSQATRMYYTANQQVGDAGDTGVKTKAVFAQIVASAFLNESNDTRGEHTAGYSYLPNWKAQLGKQAFQATEGFVGWNPRTMANGTKIGTRTITLPMQHTMPLGDAEGGGHGAASLPPDIDERVKFDGDRPNQTTRHEEMGNLKKMWPIKLSETPHYRYRLDYLDRAAGGVVSTVAPSGSGALYVRAAAALKYAPFAVTGGWQQVGYSNLGELVFVKAAGNPDWIAQFTVTWTEGLNGARFWSRFDVSLDPADTHYAELPDP